jgi:hypothetical protein
LSKSKSDSEKQYEEEEDIEDIGDDEDDAALDDTV